MVLSHAGSVLLRLWTLRTAGWPRRGTRRASALEGDTAHVLPQDRRLAGDGVQRMSPVCSQLVGAGVGWSYC